MTDPTTIAYLGPAYGRHYQKIEEIKDDLRADKDFIIQNTFGRLAHWYQKPTNLPQLHQAGITHVRVRYGRWNKVATIELESL